MENKGSKSDYIVDAINAAYKKMLEYKIRNNQRVVTKDIDGVVKAMDPRVVYERAYGKYTND